MKDGAPNMISQSLLKGIASDKVEVFRQSSCFANLPEDKLNEISCLTTLCHFEKGEFIFQQGEKPRFLYVVKEGVVKLFRQSVMGKNLTVGVHGRGDSLHSTVLFYNAEYWASAQAMSAVTTLCITRQDFLDFVDKNPCVAKNFIYILAKQVRRAYGRLTDMAVDRVDQRLVNILCMLSSKFGNNLYFTAEELADLTGTTIETTFRVMSKLKTEGIIRTSRGKIVILDEHSLRSLSDNLFLLFY
jgi:CRP-like cAMP-binding protein